MTTSVVMSVVVVDEADVRERLHVPEGVDYVEIRADRWRAPFERLAQLIAAVARPVIATVRWREEGGEFSGTEAERQRALEILGTTAAFVDVEARASWSGTLDTNAAVIASWHDFVGTPTDCRAQLAELRRLVPTARWYKLAVTPRNAADVLRICELGREGTDDIAFMAMGELGAPTRTAAGILGSRLTYGSASTSTTTAPGQRTARDLIETYRVPEQRSHWSIYAVAGNPVAHSLSPALHNAAFRSAGLDRAYITLWGSEFDAVQQLALGLDVRGLSVTIPFKQAAFEVATEPCDGTVPWPVSARALNTLLRTANGWSGANTDPEGIRAALAPHLPTLKGRRVALLGAGGAARGAAAVFAEDGAELSIFARREEAAQELAADFAAESITDLAAALGRADLIVNATPLGMHPHEHASPIPDDAPLRRDHTVFDMVYRPPRTPLLRAAEKAGATTIGGAEMLLGQAVRQARWFCECDPDIVAMRTALERELTTAG